MGIPFDQFSDLHKNQRVITNFHKSLKFYIKSIYDNCVLKKIDDVQEQRFINVINEILYVNCFKRAEVMAIYEWMQIPKWHIITDYKGILFFDFFNEYKTKRGSKDILYKIIDDLKNIHKNE